MSIYKVDISKFKTESWENDWYECSNCGYDSLDRGHNHCPNCGEGLDWTEDEV